MSLSTPTGLVVNDLNGGSGSSINGNTISVSTLAVTVDALKTNGTSNVLASPRIRARNKEKAKILIGSRVPTITTAVTPTGVGGTTIANTQVQYLDVGLSLAVEPTVYSNDDVAIKVALEVSSIVNTVKIGQTIAYEIGTRNATTLLQLKDGETQILAGLIKDSDTKSASKIPGLGDIPLLGRLFADTTTKKDKSEIVLSITPRIIRARARPSSDNSEFWYGTESRTGMAPLGSGSRPVAQAAAAPALGAATAPAPAVPVAQLAIASPPANVTTTGAGTVVGPAAAAAGVASPGPVAGMGADGVPPAAIRANRFRGATGVSAVKPADSGAAPQLTTSIEGPAELKVGDEFALTLQLGTTQPVARVRAQLRFDVTAFQFVSGDAGDLVSSATDAKVKGFAGGAQIDASAPADQPFNGSGSLMVLKFKALQAKPQAAFAAQVTALNEAGAAAASSSPDPLLLSVSSN